MVFKQQKAFNTTNRIFKNPFGMANETKIFLTKFIKNVALNDNETNFSKNPREENKCIKSLNITK